jgi:hypothetical protein
VLKEFLDVKDDGVFKKLEQDIIIKEHAEQDRQETIEQENEQWEQSKNSEMKNSRWLSVVMNEKKTNAEK